MMEEWEWFAAKRNLTSIKIFAPKNPHGDICSRLWNKLYKTAGTGAHVYDNCDQIDKFLRSYLITRKRQNLQRTISLSPEWFDECIVFGVRGFCQSSKGGYICNQYNVASILLEWNSVAW